MWMTISSNDRCPELDRHFRVWAGPGAGKTHWLSNHIREVVSKSPRLPPAARVACISYTKVAVAELLTRLEECAGQVEGSTIHSFLYRNIVRPYLYLLKDENGQPLVNHKKVDGHDEHRPSHSLLEAWLRSTDAKPFNISKFLYRQRSAVWSYLQKLHWKQEGGEWKWAASGRIRPPQYFPVRSLNTYKPLYWAQGTIDHSDVLYFSYLILERHPELIEFFSAKYPFVFVDEFQDTNPIQTQVLRWLAGAGTIVGVIGDPAQSIYEFNGACPADFRAFQLEDRLDFKIENNRRSTDVIIQVLNRMRSDDLEQRGLRNSRGENVKVIIGDLNHSIRHAISILAEGQELAVLGRSNEEVAIVRNDGVDSVIQQWGDFSSIDRNRHLLMDCVAKSIAQAQNGHIAQAVADLSKVVVRSNGNWREPINCPLKSTKDVAQGIAITILEQLLSSQEEFDRWNIADAYLRVGEAIVESCPEARISRVQPGGRISDSIAAINFGQLTRSVKLPEETRNVRTIHQVKGTEFDNVFVTVADVGRLEKCLAKKPDNSEEARILYVAFSRARNRLFIHVPEPPSASLSGVLTDLGVHVVDHHGNDAAVSDSHALTKNQGSLF